MATLQLLPVTTINGTTYATAQLILTPVSPDRQKTILPKQEPVDSPCKSSCSTSTTSSQDFKLLKKPSESIKRRIHFSKKALSHPRPQSVTRRNARERNRVKQVNQSFVTLANHVPPEFRSKKMSKVDTLRAAIEYIDELQSMLDMPTSSGSHTTLPQTPQSDYSIPSPISDYPESPVYQTQRCQLTTESQTVYPSYTPQLSHNSYQPQLQQFQSNINNTYNYYDYSPNSNGTCPSPTGSSDSGFESHDQITPEVEAEILEFASWFQ